MKRLLLILVLTFSFQSWTKADDIRNLEIEGISIGDSLLDFISEKYITKQINHTKDHYKYLKDPIKFREVYIFKSNNFKTYTNVSLMFRLNDNKYKILFVRGMKNYVENLSGCFKQRDEIAKEIESSISNITKDVRENISGLDESGKSIYYNTYYTLSSGDGIIIACNNWDEKLRKKNNWTEGLSVVMRTKEVGNWLQGN
tara:strand:+ start:203 stop:802 length:600 start_codon:yes stop_codon:yes gene_type:complete